MLEEKFLLISKEQTADTSHEGESAYEGGGSRFEVLLFCGTADEWLIRVNIIVHDPTYDL